MKFTLFPYRTLFRSGILVYGELIIGVIDIDVEITWRGRTVLDVVRNQHMPVGSFANGNERPIIHRKSFRHLPSHISPTTSEDVVRHLAEPVVDKLCAE